MPPRDNSLWRGDYPRRAKTVRDAANADPTTKCWRCGRTLIEHGPGDTWQAGHIRSSDPTSPLAPEARSCNIREMLHRRNHPERAEPRSKQWDF